MMNRAKWTFDVLFGPCMIMVELKVKLLDGAGGGGSGR